MARKRANLSDLLNDLTFRSLFNKYRLLACSAFEWDGLPDGIKSRHIEPHLFDHGRAIFFRDPAMAFMCLECHDGGQFNVYGDALKYVATGHGYTKHYDASECVIIENNMFRMNTADIVTFYINKITEAERTMDVNTKAVKTPYIIACDDKDVLTFKTIFQKIDGNVPAIYADRSLSLDSINVLQTGAKFMGNELMDYKKSVENELLTFLGFNNLAVDKKERVNVSEADSNNQITESFADLQLSARQKACEEINKMFGLNLSVKRKVVIDDVGNNDVRHDKENN